MQFDDVKGAYCRIYDDKTGSEFVRYSLSENMDNISDGCIVASLNRHEDNDTNSWSLKALGYYTKNT
jgi:stress response protein SCP2